MYLIMTNQLTSMFYDTYNVTSVLCQCSILFFRTESDECKPPGSLYCELTTLSSKPAHFTCTENVSTIHTSQLESDLQARHSDAPMAGSPPESSATNVSVNDGSSKDDGDNSYIEKGPDTSSSPAIIPVYAVPDKLKKKV